MKLNKIKTQSFGAMHRVIFPLQLTLVAVDFLFRFGT